VDDRIPMSAEWLAEMQAAGEMRAETITQLVLQQPDYPALPACPKCGAAAERITSKVEDPAFGQYETRVLVNFAPCGHRFRAAAVEIQRA
jgi:hypothetical protein